jgi:hypothetical protein
MKRRITITIPVFRVGYPRPVGLPQEVRAWRQWIAEVTQ